MKLGEILNAAGERRNWVDFFSEWDVSYDGYVDVYAPYNVKLSDDVDVVYFWYHHMMPTRRRQTIQSAIDSGDFKTFYENYVLLGEERTGMTYLPDMATIFHRDDVIGQVCVAANEDMLKLITFSESECG